jgi:glutamate-ammonia-ligase adenylyltransferase
MKTVTLPESLAEEGRHLWDEFCQAAESAGIPFSGQARHAEEARRVFALSDFVARSAIRNPEMFTDLMASGDLFGRYPAGAYDARITEALAGVDGESALGRQLRQVRLREMVRIAWRDLGTRADLSETVADLSDFADACIRHALDWLHRWQAAASGPPAAADGSLQYLVVVAMGKLGGRELNFSSDIDLIFAYPEAGATTGPKGLDNEAFFLHLARRLLKVLGENSADGPLFRVDMRLRPYGEAGPLVMNFDQMENYYQTQGRPWERYAWIKARVVGDGDNTVAGLIARLEPFVYRRYFDYGAFEALRDMKQKIAMEVLRKHMADNIKLGPGGIREVEFFGQIFQLIRGGVEPELQEPAILKVLDRLARRHYIPDTVRAELEAAYVFLRNTEHRIQEFADRQSHSLPTDARDRLRLAVAMGFDRWDAFSLALAGHMHRVHAHFDKLLVAREPEGADEKHLADLKSLWMGLCEPEAAQAALTAVGYPDPEPAAALLVYLRQASETRALSRDGRRNLDQLMPQVIKAAGSVAQPAVTLNRIVELIRTVEQRTTYLSLLLEHPDALDRLVKLVAASPWVGTFLTQHPVLLDELLDPRTLFLLPDRQDLEQDLKSRLARVADTDLEYQMEVLRIFKQVNVLRIAAADVSGLLPLMRVSDHLTDVAETVLGQVLELSWKHLVQKHGRPSCRLDGANVGRGFAVIAYGKLGAFELGYGSDLDLVFLHAGTGEPTTGGARPMDSGQFFARLGQRVLHLLSIQTAAGVLYEVDMRLRPSGVSGMLVSHVDAFNDYQRENAWTWEHQALVRARPVGGDPALGSQFQRIRQEVLSRPRDPEGLRAEVVDMRERMRKQLLSPDPKIFDIKQDRGGMVDVEFLVEYLILRYSPTCPALTHFTDVVRTLQTLSRQQVVADETAFLLKKAYLSFRAEAHRLSLQNLPTRVPEDRFIVEKNHVTKIWKSFLG